MNEKLKECVGCYRLQPHDRFGVDKSQPDGLSKYCRVCIDLNHRPDTSYWYDSEEDGKISLIRHNKTIMGIHDKYRKQMDELYSEIDKLKARLKLEGK